MTSRQKWLLVLEVFLSFTPIILLWLWGLLVVPGSLAETVQGRETYYRFLSAMLLGGLGIVGVFLGLKSAVQAGQDRTRIILSIILILAGLGALSLGLHTSLWFRPLGLLFFWLPSAASVHLLVLLVRRLTRPPAEQRAKPARGS